MPQGIRYVLFHPSRFSMGRSSEFKIRPPDSLKTLPMSLRKLPGHDRKHPGPDRTLPGRGRESSGRPSSRSRAEFEWALGSRNPSRHDWKGRKVVRHQQRLLRDEKTSHSLSQYL